MRSAVRRAFGPFLPTDGFSKADRRVIAVIWVAGLIQGFSQSQASSGLPFTRDGLGLSEGEISLLLGLARLGAFLALPLGWLGDHQGRRKPYLLAISLMLGGVVASGLVFEAWQFGLAQAVLRTGTAAASGLAVVILAESVSKPVRAYSISFYGAAVSLGSGLALMALPLADDGGNSWRTPYLLAGVGVLLLPLLVAGVPETQIFDTSPHDGHWSDLLMGVWANRFWTVVAINMLASAYGAIGAAFATERLIEGLGLSTGDTILILLGGGTLGGVGFFLGGHLADAWGRRRTSILSLLLSVIGGVTLYTATSIPLVTAAAMVSAFGTFAFVPSGGAHRAELFPTKLRSSANTAASNAATAGSALGLIAGIFTIDVYGLQATIVGLAVGATIAAALTLLLPETRGQDLTAVRADVG